MQEKKVEKLAPIKGRIHKYLRIKGITQEVFFSELGISDSSFKGRSGKSEFGGDILARVVAKYPNLSTRWLLTGEGEMESSSSSSKVLGNDNIVTAGGSTHINARSIGTATPTESILTLEYLLQVQEHLQEQCREKDRQIDTLLRTLSTLSTR